MPGGNGWAFVEAGDRLREMLAGLQEPARLAAVQAGDRLQAHCAPTSRPASTGSGFSRSWVWAPVWLTTWDWAKPSRLSLLLLAQKVSAGKSAPSLLVFPASLSANWKSELRRFAPSLKVVCLTRRRRERRHWRA